MANPRVDEETKEARGTSRPDRTPPAPPAPDPDEKKPIRPHRVDGYGRDFWNKHFNKLWDAGWLSRANVESFITLCIMYDGMRKLEDIWREEGQTQTTHSQYGSKEVSHPAWTEYKSMSNQVLTWMDKMGLTPEGEIKKLAGLEPRKPKDGDGDGGDDIEEFKRRQAAARAARMAQT